ncbi:MAG: proton-conducting transporter membrane subunit [Candidatus Bathyarchaeia archaeon]
MLVPIVALFGRAFRLEKLKDLFSISVLAVTVYYIHRLQGYVEASPSKVVVYHLAAYSPPLGVSYRADHLSIFMAYLFVGVGLLVAVYSLKYMEHDIGVEKYYALLLAMVGGMVGVSFAGDLFNLFIFWEVMSISAYVLVAYRKHHWEPVEASFKYLVMSTFGSILFLYAMSFLYGLTGTLDMTYVAEGLALVKPSGIVLLALAAMFICGFGVTASIVPFHTWLPDAHPAAPASISAMLSGVVIKVGVYAVYRVLFTVFDPFSFDFGTVLILFGLVTMTVANLMALLQSDVKRLLAYSSVVNIGYILAGVGIGAYALSNYYPTTPTVAALVAVLAIEGSLFHIFNHAVGKGLLFLGTGCFIHEAKSRDLSELEGIGRRMPWTGFSFSIGLLTLAGVPPFSGFWSKLFIILAGFNLAQSPFLVGATIVIVLNSILAAVYYLWVLQRLVIKAPRPAIEMAREVSPIMVAPIVILAVITILAGVWPGLVINAVESATRALIGW